jgi:mono/diheme cytochrome c family protein
VGRSGTRIGKVTLALCLVAAVGGCGGQGPEQALSGPAAQGQELVEQHGCLSCHSTDGSRGAGPSWEGLVGSEVSLADGSTVVAEEGYLLRSILEPDADTVAGFPEGLMASAVPPGALSEDEGRAVVAYLKTLSDEGGNSEGTRNDR